MRSPHTTTKTQRSKKKLINKLKKNTFIKEKCYKWDSLAVQWLGLGAFTAKGPGSIPGWGTKIPEATWGDQKKKKKGYK